MHWKDTLEYKIIKFNIQVMYKLKSSLFYSFQYHCASSLYCNVSLIIHCYSLILYGSYANQMQQRKILFPSICFRSETEEKRSRKEKRLYFLCSYSAAIHHESFDKGHYMRIVCPDYYDIILTTDQSIHVTNLYTFHES